MDRRLVKIKRLVAAGHYDFTHKADVERIADGLSKDDIVESIVSAQFMRVKNSTSLFRKGQREKVYIIDSFNFEGVPIYSKGVIRKVGSHEDFYILISGKRSTASS